MGWKKESLVDLVESLHQGLNTAGEKIKFVDSGYPIIQTRNLDNGKVDLDHKIKFMSQEDWDKYKDKYRPEVGDVFFTNIGTIGKTAIVNKSDDYLIHWNIFKIRPLSDKLTPAYLKYRLDYLTNSGFFTDSQKGGTVNFVTKKMMSSVEIPLPPIPKQKRIVAILDQAFADIELARAKTEQNLLNARELFESYLQQVFSPCNKGWEYKCLGDVLLDKPRNGWSPPAKSHADIGVPVLTLSSVTGFDFKSEKIKFTSALTKADSHYWAENGDLLITRSNTPELVGHVAICAGIKTPTIYPDLIMKLKLDTSIVITPFIYYQLRSKNLRQLITSSAQGANPTMKKINQGVVQGLPIGYPDTGIQKAIVERFDSIYCASSKLQVIYQKKLIQLEELKKSILQKAFSGELTKAPAIKTKKGAA